MRGRKEIGKSEDGSQVYDIESNHFWYQVAAQGVRE